MKAYSRDWSLANDRGLDHAVASGASPVLCSPEADRFDGSFTPTLMGLVEGVPDHELCRLGAQAVAEHLGASQPDPQLAVPLLRENTRPSTHRAGSSPKVSHRTCGLSLDSVSPSR